MPEDIKQSTPDPLELINNAKAETDRKFANLEASIQSQLQQLPDLINQSVAKYAQPATSDPYTAPAVDQSMEILDNPKGFVEDLKKEITKAVSDQVNTTLTSYEDRTASRSQLFQEFPELSDPNNKMTQAVMARFNGLTIEQKKDADQHLKSIVYQVASEHGIRPVSTRVSDDNFSLGGAQGEANVNPGQESKKSDGIKQGSLDWATILKEVGADIDLDDPKQLEKLKEYAKRRNWTSIDQSPAFKRGGK